MWSTTSSSAIGFDPCAFMAQPVTGQSKTPKMDIFKRQSPEGPFWSWFAANADEIGLITSGDNPLVEKLSEEVKRVHQDLVFEVGKAKDGAHEIVISVDGIKSAIPHVEALVAAAPE